MRAISRSLLNVPFSLAILLAVSMSLLSGCGLSKSDMAGPEPVVGPALGGHVHGGQQPVSGSRVYMFQAQLNGYGAAAESELKHAAITGNPAGGATDADGTYVLTDAGGNFTITGGYNCKSGMPVYLLAKGGNPGIVGTASVDNDKLALMAVLGLCPAGGTFSSAEEVIVNEATTVAAAYALSGFLTGPTQLSIPMLDSQATTGLVNATANAGQLVDTSTGLARTATPNGNGIVPQQEIYTLANILAACVNTDGTETDDDNAPTGCYSVLNGVEGYSAPDTISLLLHVVGSPGPTTVANLYPLSTKVSAFQPALTGVPNNFILSIGFSGGGLSDGEIPAVDAEGNVWVPNYSGLITGLSPRGDFLTPDGGLVLEGEFEGLSLGQAAVDPHGNIWLVADQGGLVVKLRYSPPDFTTNTYCVSSQSCAGLDDTHQIAIDNVGNVYASDYTAGVIYKLDNDGSAASGYVPSRITGFQGVAMLSDTEFFAGYSTSSGQEFDSDGGLVGSSTSCASYMDTSCGLSSPTAFAVDSKGDIWATNYNNTLARFSLTASSGAPISGGGLNIFYVGQNPPVTWLAIDGGGSVWVPNSGGGSISEFDNSGAALSPDPAGFQIRPGTCFPNGLAIDGSGDVWVTCDGGGAPVVEFIGAAVPVYTPLTPGHFGQRP